MMCHSGTISWYTQIRKNVASGAEESPELLSPLQSVCPLAGPAGPRCQRAHFTSKMLKLFEVGPQTSIWYEYPRVFACQGDSLAINRIVSVHLCMITVN